MKKNLFEGEEVVRIWNECTLTNKRVWRLTEERGQSDYLGFPIDKFQGAKIGKTSYPWLMYIGVGICVLAFASLFSDSQNKTQVFITTFAIGAIFLAVWHATKRAKVQFCSSQINIEVGLHGNDEEFNSVVSFISDVEQLATQSKVKAISAA